MYEAFMNPMLLAETRACEYGWEYCASFPLVRAQVRRPLGIKVSYLSETGDEVEEEMHDFRARVFLHEYDHVIGRNIMHWHISEGNVEVLPVHVEESRNLDDSIRYYRQKIEELRQEHPDSMDDRRTVSRTEQKGGESWNVFAKGSQQGRKVMDVSFNEAMIIDLIRSARRDKLFRDAKLKNQT